MSARDFKMWVRRGTWTKAAGARAGVSGSRSKRPAATHPVLQTLDNARHRIPFWWWLTYDALVALVIVAGISPSDPAFWLGFAVLFIAVVIDTVEFIVKRPSAAAVLRPPTPEGEQ